MAIVGTILTTVSSIAGPVLGIVSNNQQPKTGGIDYTGTFLANDLSEYEQREQQAKTKKNILIGVGVLLFLIITAIVIKKITAN